MLVAAAVTVYTADQLTKAWAAATLPPEQPRHLIGSVLQLNLIRNPGAAFSIGTGYTWILTLVACSVVAVIVATSRRLGSWGWAWALGLLLGGALGNLTDRMVREPGLGRGHVVDFIAAAALADLQRRRLGGRDRGRPDRPARPARHRRRRGARRGRASPSTPTSGAQRNV